MDQRPDTKMNYSPEEPETSNSTLLPMLIGGLALIVIGAIGVMMFV